MPRAPIKTYRDLVVWDKAIDLAVAVHRFCDDLQAPRFFTLTDQLRRAAGSIPSNIVEGYGRRSRGDNMRFVSISNGSLCELETQLLLARRAQEFAGKALTTPAGCLLPTAYCPSPSA
jgi:four helix bundle protein